MRSLAFDPVLLGQTEVRGLLAPKGSAQLTVLGDPALSGVLTEDLSRVEVSFLPSRPGQAGAEVQVLNDQGQALAIITVRARGRAPDLRVVPSAVQLGVMGAGGAAQASLWAFPESDVIVRVADEQWPACPAQGACVQVVSERAQRGLPAAFILRSPAAASVPSSITLSTCDHPGCAVTVEVSPATASGGLRCTPGVLELPAAAVAHVASISLHCEGDTWAATSAHPEVSVIMTSSTTAQVQWRPEAEGPLSTALDLGPGHMPVPVRGYALDAPACALTLTPQRLSFGAVAVNATAQGLLSVSNVAGGDCLVAGVQTRPATEFGLGTALPQWLASGQHLEVALEFTPQGRGLRVGTAHVQAAAEAPLFARLEGEGVQASLRVLEPRIELGTLAQCGVHTVPIVIVNEGAAPGLLTGIEVSTEGPVEVRFSVGLPVTIPAGASFSVLAFVEAQGPGPVAAQVRLELDQGGTPARTVAQLSATVAPHPTQEDEFEQLALPQVDVLLVVDDGPGFTQEQAYLQSSLGELAWHPSFSNVNARFAVMPASLADPARLGHLIPADAPSMQVVSSTNAEVRRDAVSALVGLVGSSGSTRSEGLQAILRTLSAPGGDALTRLLRPEAQLSILVITTRDDTSAGPVSDYLSALFDIKGPNNRHRLYVAVVGGPPPTGCVDGDLSAEPTPRYHELVQQTGGLALSICDRTWPQRLVRPTFSFGFKSRFFLSQPALEATIEVYVQGERVPPYQPSGANNWSYDVATNSVNFSPFGVPEPSAQIRVRYEVGCP